MCWGAKIMLNRASSKCYFVKTEYWSRAAPAILTGSPLVYVSHTLALWQQDSAWQVQTQNRVLSDIFPATNLQQLE